MAKENLVTLTPEERASLRTKVDAGGLPARTVTRIHALLRSEQAPGGPARSDSQIVKALGHRLRSVESLRKRFVRHGSGVTVRGLPPVHRQPRHPSVLPRHPGMRPRTLDDRRMALMLDLASGPPPENVLPLYESGVRRLMADADGSEYRAFPSLTEARDSAEAVVVFEGDYGGQIYVVAPVAYVHCDEVALSRLLADIDALKWNDSDGARVFFERRAVGEGGAGGMGGGVVVPGVWVHSELRPLRGAIVARLAGEAGTIRQ
ncbi:MAG: hypothetical protein U0821_14345 [Chloroflexota bacterium]